MAKTSQRKRADLLLVDRGLAESREQAQTLIAEGLVFSRAGRVLKASSILPGTDPLEVRGNLPYVSRGGLKLAYALDTFKLTVDGFTVLDVGASTGGFTDCLLQRGAERVYAIDVGHGQLAYKLRQDSRVAVIEKLNARNPFELPEAVDLITIDVSFISLTMVIPSALQHLKEGSYVAALVKPQFEARREEVGKGGVIKDPKIHAAVLSRTINWAINAGLRVRNLCPSPILGDAGNREFFLLLQKPAKNSTSLPPYEGGPRGVAPPHLQPNIKHTGDEPMEVTEIAELLIAQGKTVSVAEADTMGLIGYMLGTVPGSSAYCPGGVIAYTGGLKQSVLGVTDETYNNFGSVSREVAIAMAKGVRELCNTDYALSTTGVTGPAQGRSSFPIGTFWIGLAVKDGEDVAIEVHLSGDRDATKRGAAQAALDLLGKHLKGG